MEPPGFTDPMAAVSSTSPTPGSDSMVVMWDTFTDWIRAGIPDQGNALDLLAYNIGRT